MDVFLMQPFSNLCRFPKVKRSAFLAVKRNDSSGRQTSRIIFCKAVRKNLEVLPLNTFAVLTIQIEIRMVGQIDDGVLVAQRLIVDAQSTFIIKGIAHRHQQIARVAFFPIAAQSGKGQAVLPHCCPPQAAMEAGRSPMQVVLSIVDCQLIGLAVEHKTSAGNAVGMTSRYTAQAGGLPLIRRCVVTAQHNVLQRTLSVMHQQRNHRCSIIGQAHRLSSRICDGIQAHLAPIAQLSKILSFYCHFSLPPVVFVFIIIQQDALCNLIFPLFSAGCFVYNSKSRCPAAVKKKYIIKGTPRQKTPAPKSALPVSDTTDIATAVSALLP